MRGSKNYKVTCKACGESDIVSIFEPTHTVLGYGKMIVTPLLAARWRPDAQWGWECQCGNYSLLADEERKDFDKLVAGTPMRIAQIAKMLEKRSAERFVMEGV